MKPFLINLAWILVLGSAHATTVEFNQTSVNDVDGSVIAAVNLNDFQETGNSYTTITAPAVYQGFRFTHWSNSSEPAAIYRDPWGRSQNPVSFTLLEDTTLTAHYLPATLDSNGDGVPDWYKIEYYGTLDIAADSDTDGDGRTLLEEFQNGTHPLYANHHQAGGVARAESGLITFNRDASPTYILRSVPAGTVDLSEVVPPGTVVTTPNLTQPTFGYWTLDGVPQRDPWGVALRQITFTMENDNREAVAWFFSGDDDGDGLPDAWEWFYLGTTAHDGSADLNGDGFTLLQIYQAGRAPTFAYAMQPGGVAWADSALVTVNFADFSQYTITSNPPGTVEESAIVADGTTVTTPNMTQNTFGYWTLDGVEQRDAWGVALRQISFTMEGGNRTAVAHFFTGDSDGDGIPDAWELYYFGTLSYDADDSPGGDGWSLLDAYLADASPLFAQSHLPGGVSWADSETVIVNLQPFERLSKILINGVLAEFFSPDPHTASGIYAGPSSSPALTDWDGDGSLDLFVAHQNGLRVFRNIGTARNPNFQEITTGFGGLAAYIASVDRPVIAGGDWNGDGFGDLVIGGNTGTLRLVTSSGGFNSNGNGVDITVASTKARPALGDMNGNGLADLLVLLDDGTVSLLLNNGTPLPYSGNGVTNYLGTPVPDATSIAVGDVNQNGRPDVLVADLTGRIWEFHNDGNGGFSLQSRVWAGSYPGFADGLTLAVADLDGDGDLDLVAGLDNGGILGLRDPSVGRPTGLIARPGPNSVQLEWDASWQSRIRGYFVYRTADPAGASWDRLTPDILPLPGYLDSPVNPAMQHHYHVTGVSRFFLPGNSTPRIVESLPSDTAVAETGRVILNARPARGNPGSMIRINLAIENTIGVSGDGLEIRIAYDPDKLQPWAQANPDDATVITSGLSNDTLFTDNGATADGEILIEGSGGSLRPGSGKFLTLQFEVAAELPEKTLLGFSILEASLFDVDGIPLIVEIRPSNPPETGDAYFEGDLNGDGIVSNMDADLLKELLKPNARPPTAEELMAGDLNGDGVLDVRDLVLLTQMLNSP